MKMVGISNPAKDFYAGPVFPFQEKIDLSLYRLRETSLDSCPSKRKGLNRCFESNLAGVPFFECEIKTVEHHLKVSTAFLLSHFFH